MPSQPAVKKIRTENRVAPAIWLFVLTAASVVKIVVGSVYVNGGCLGFQLLPFYFLIGGFLTLVPACIAFLATFYKRSRELEDFWETAAKLFFVSVAFLITATIHTLVSAARVNSLDRLCLDQWVPMYGFCAFGVDWIMFAIFIRLFCVHSVPQDTDVSLLEDEFQSDKSPFHMWKQRQNESI